MAGALAVWLAQRVGQNCRDVVWRAVFEGVADQAVYCDLTVLVRDQLEDLAVFHHRGQTVRAQKEAVTRFQLAVGGLKQQLPIGADRPGNNVGPGMVTGLFGGYFTGIDECLDYAVICRDLA